MNEHFRRKLQGHTLNRATRQRYLDSIKSNAAIENT
jgi:hypothetical protein